MTDLSAVRKRAWKTRREKYGKKGHSGVYGGMHCSCEYRIRLMERALIRLHVEEVLSEGQVAKMTGLDRISVRTIADQIIYEKDHKNA